MRPSAGRAGPVGRERARRRVHARVAAVPAAYLRDGLTLALLCLVSFITGSAFVFFSIAEQSSIKQVVGGGQLNRALAVTLLFVRYRTARRLTLAALAWRSRGSDLDQVR